MGLWSPVWPGGGKQCRVGVERLPALMGQTPGAVQAGPVVARPWHLGWVSELRDTACPESATWDGIHSIGAALLLCPADVGTGQHSVFSLLLHLLCFPLAVPKTKSTVQGWKGSACLKDQVCSNLTLSLG